ncbi:MAG: ATP-binding protein [Pseudomonadota bacterium]
MLELPSGLPRVLVDPDQIRQVFSNLFMNAQQAMDGGKGKRILHIRTSYNETRDSIIAIVRDTGPGVKPELSSRIFEPLFTTKEPGAGTGLGLALCRRLVETNDGAINLAESSSKGATFSVSFPAAGPETTMSVGPRHVASRRKGRLETLIIDDRLEEGQHLAKILGEMGHGVEIVETSYVGFQRVRDHAYGAIFCRVSPGEQAPSACLKTVRDARKSAAKRLIFVTGSRVTPELRSAIDVTERPLLATPFGKRDVKEVVELLTLRGLS